MATLLQRSIAHPDRRRARAALEVARGLRWVSPWVVGTLAFLAVPVAMSVYYSFTEYSLLEPPVFVGTENYREMLHDHLFWTALRNTAAFALASTLLGTAGSTLIA